MFQNREEAGKLLSQKLLSFKKRRGAVVLAIPRGGVLVGREIANNLSLPLYPLIVKKLGAPNNPELAIGAVAPNGVKYIDWDLALRSGVGQEYLDKEIKKKRGEIKERENKFSLPAGGLALRMKEKKTAILTDDGIATGATTLAAIKYLRHIRSRPKNENLTIILAVPVIAKDTYERLQSEADMIVALEVLEAFGAVGEFYRDFPQVTDEEVIKML